MRNARVNAFICSKGLVRVSTNHTLSVRSVHPACELWFAFADLMMRTVVGKMRSKMGEKKAGSCSARQAAPNSQKVANERAG